MSLQQMLISFLQVHGLGIGFIVNVRPTCDLLLAEIADKSDTPPDASIRRVKLTVSSLLSGSACSWDRLLITAEYTEATSLDNVSVCNSIVLPPTDLMRFSSEARADLVVGLRWA